MTSDVFDQAARAIASSTVLVITSGAGMGVDSGLPDFRGTSGFWQAYPAFARLGLHFEELANPRWFDEDPSLAWGFYGHRLQLYRSTLPHEGHRVLHRWSSSRRTLLFTSNVDGMFQMAGLDGEALYEVHGSIHHLQCTRPCTPHVWAAREVALRIDPDRLRATGDLPRCSRCGSLARPNVLMFGDGQFVETRAEAQARRYVDALRAVEGRPTVVVEAGAGTALPTVCRHSESLQRRGTTLVRINPREAHGPRGTLSLAMGAAAGLCALDERVHELEG